MLIVELQKKIEERLLEEQQRVADQLEQMGQPTVDQYMSGMGVSFHGEFDWIQRDYIMRTMVMYMDDIVGKPKVIVAAAAERFSEFLINFCSIEEWVITIQRLKHFGVQLPETKAFEQINETIGQLTNDMESTMC